MTKKTYNILLDDKIIGTTELENSDAPMGVVYGNIKLNDISSPYEFFKSYCVTNRIEIMSDYPEDKLIATSDIPKLKVINSSGVEIKGQGTSMTVWTVTFSKSQFWEFLIHFMRKNSPIT